MSLRPPFAGKAYRSAASPQGEMMREKELREVAKCIGCGKAFGHTGLPLFWRVTIERYGVDMKAINRQQGLTMMLGGNALLAQVMGADEMATCLSSQKVTLCEECAMKEHNLFVLSEKAAEQSVEQTGDSSPEN